MITANNEKLCQCPVCLTLNPASNSYCDQCHAHLTNINPKCIQHTLSLLLTSYLLFIPANFLPMMVTTVLGSKTESTILGGVILLWEHQSYLVALIIFFASIVIPLGKLFALTWLCYQANYTGFSSKKMAYRSYHITEFIGKWSMVDIYVVSILVALVNMGEIVKIEAGYAAAAFTGFVLMTMLAANTFDPRLIWQSKPIEATNDSRK
ncbi:paraquat-inducible protein A [Pseudocolwellia sp. HL-MZ19]|uniref:paraquat-inducible protein A n=1 Tax=unclassified Pseudocolwellia TaxID=2848178 RepID=UPI003CEF8FEA